MGEYIEIKNNIISDKEIDKTVFNDIQGIESDKYIRMKIESTYTIGVSETNNNEPILMICNMSDPANPQPDEYQIYTIKPKETPSPDEQNGGSLFHVKTHKRKPHRYTYKK